MVIGIDVETRIYLLLFFFVESCSSSQGSYTREPLHPTRSLMEQLIRAPFIGGDTSRHCSMRECHTRMYTDTSMGNAKVIPLNFRQRRAAHPGRHPRLPDYFSKICTTSACSSPLCPARSQQRKPASGAPDGGPVYPHPPPPPPPLSSANLTCTRCPPRTTFPSPRVAVFSCLGARASPWARETGRGAPGRWTSRDRMCGSMSCARGA